MIKANPSPTGNGFAFNLFGDLAGNRTRDCAVRGRRLNRLTTRPCFLRTKLPRSSKIAFVVYHIFFQSATVFAPLFQ